MPESDPSEVQQDPDVQLMLEAARGSEFAFAELIHRHQNGRWLTRAESFY